MTSTKQTKKKGKARSADVIRQMLSSARKRARAAGVECYVTEEHVHVPALCPVLGTPLEPGVGCSVDSSPTLDRIHPDRGYVPGNVIVVSNLANRIKTNASIEQIERVAAFYRQLID